MPLKFRLKGLAETFVDRVVCPKCKHNGGDGGDQGFSTEFSKVTFEGIIAVIRCECCEHIFVPDNQKLGVVNGTKLRTAIKRDRKATGQAIYQNLEEVKLEVERLNATRNEQIH